MDLKWKKKNNKTKHICIFEAFSKSRIMTFTLENDIYDDLSPGKCSNLHLATIRIHKVVL